MLTSWRTRLITLGLLVGLLPGAWAQSQATTGVIEGTVVDESGGAIPGANVTIRNTATNYERQITTDRDGRFRGLLLPLGPYKVTVSLTGFSTLVRDGLNLSVGQTVNLPLALKVSSIQEEVIVSGESPVIETTRAEGADKIDEASIKGLPNNGRNFLDFTSSPPASPSCRGRTATSSRSTARRASSTTSRWTVPTSTIRSSASSAAASAPPSPSTSTR